VEKIVHITLDYFLEGGRKDGWIADGLHRDFIGTNGLSKISGLNLSDLFILTDADELPRHDVLLFLKGHDGYTEPISILYQCNIFGFFWSPRSPRGAIPQTQQIFAVTTIGMIRYVFQNKVYGVRTAKRFFAKNQLAVQTFTKLGGRILSWAIGAYPVTAGWHCSWCLGIKRIQNKLLSAQNGDFTRWGDYPDKANISYIKSLGSGGVWFDEKGMFTRMNVSGPEHLMKNILKFKHIIYNGYAN